MKLNPRLTNDCSGVIPLYVPCLKCMTLAYLYDTNIHNKKSTHTYLVLNQTHNFSLTIRGGQLVELLYKRSSRESDLKQVSSELEVVKLYENGLYRVFFIEGQIRISCKMFKISLFHVDSGLRIELRMGHFIIDQFKSPF